jgi:hypothetical protein
MALVTNLETASEAIQAMGYPKDPEILSFVLSRTWPFPDGQDPYDMSGLDCLMVVMRHILAQSSEINSDLSEKLQQDPLVDLCRRDFSGETPEKLANMQKERVHMFECISDIIEEEDIPFRRIVSGGAFWEELSCDPYLPVLHQKPGSERWVLAPDDSYYTPPSIRFRTTEHSTIQAAVDASFGIHENPKSGANSALFGAAPCFLSVVCVPNGEHIPNFGIDSVAEVKLPRHKPNNIEGGVVFEEAGTSRYRLIAVVRRRLMGRDEHDFVRIYDVDDKNILPLGDKSRYAGIIDDNWSLADQDRSCLLFYVRLDRPVPEGGPPRIEEVHHEEHVQTGENDGTAAAVSQVNVADGEQAHGEHAHGEHADGEHARNMQTEPKTPNKLAPPPIAPDTYNNARVVGVKAVGLRP